MWTNANAASSKNGGSSFKLYIEAMKRGCSAFVATQRKSRSKQEMCTVERKDFAMSRDNGIISMLYKKCDAAHNAGQGVQGAYKIDPNLEPFAGHIWLKVIPYNLILFELCGFRRNEAQKVKPQS